MWCVCVVALLVALTNAAPRSIADKSISAIPLQQQVMSIYSPSTEEQDAGINSLRTPPPPKSHLENVVWDPATMPHPDVKKHMNTGPDRSFVPSRQFLGGAEPVGPTHTTKRNMVFAGDSMIRSPDADPANIRQGVSPDVLQKLEGMDKSDMPVSPDLEDGPDCAEEADVLAVGELPEFSLSKILPLKATHGAPLPEVNSFKDFTSGLPQEHRIGSSDLSKLDVVPKSPASTQHELPGPTSPLLPVNQASREMGYKFSAKIQFLCSDDREKELATSYARMIREAVSVGAQVPAGNVAISSVAKGSIVSLDVGAASLADVRTEVLSLRSYTTSGGLLSRMQTSGFPLGCTVSIVSIGEGLDDHGIMPEPTKQDQMGPPGGFEEEELTPEQIKERVRVREAMTYGDYTQPHRFNISNLSPHLFSGHQESLCPPTNPNCVAVVGRLKFLLAESEWEIFASIHSKTIARALAESAKTIPYDVQLAFNNKQQPRVPHPSQRGSVGMVDLVETEAGIAEPPALLMDFAITANDVSNAREMMTDIMSSMSEPGPTGFKAQLLMLSPTFPSIEFSLLFIEIQDGQGHPVDCEDEDEDEAELEPPAQKVDSSRMNQVANCTTPVQVVPPDTSTAATPPSNSPDDWQVMAGPAVDKAYMNLPGYAVTKMHQTVTDAYPIAPEQPTPWQSTEIAAAEIVNLAQLEESSHPHLGESMKAALSQALLEQQHAATSPIRTMGSSVRSTEMPEAEAVAGTPAGGFPVQDMDPGLSM